jgi:RHS repeat-associated protein
MRVSTFAVFLSFALAALAPAAEPVTNAPGTETWTTGPYVYDGAGNVTKIGGNTYRYDPVKRVKEYLPEAGGSQSFTDDSFGNIRRIDTTPAGGSAISRIIPIDSGSNHVGSSAGALYDRAGNMLSYSGTTYKYDSQNMMVGMEGAAKRYGYVYTAADERIGTVNLLTKQWTWTVRSDGGKVLREYTSSGGTNGAAAWQWSRDYVYRGPALLASVGTDGTRHYHLDHLRSPRLVTDASAVRTAFHTYMPFGEEETSILQDRERLRFTGHERDFAGGTVSENKDYLDYMHARYYNPMLGRFLSADRARDSDPRQPQSWNQYGYVRANPVNNIDANGQWVTPIHERLIDLAFPGLSLGERAILKNASLRVDSLLTGQFPRTAYQHAMRGRKETVEQAMQKSIDFYNRKIAEARAQNADALAHRGNGTGRSEAMRMGSLQSIGEVFHMVSDAASPEHKGYQVWAPVRHPIESWDHPKGEKTIDPVTENLVVQQLRAVYGTVYGDEELQRATGKEQ